MSEAEPVLSAAEKMQIHERLSEHHRQHVALLYAVIGAFAAVMFGVFAWAWSINVDSTMDLETRVGKLEARVAVLEARLGK